MQKRAKGAKTMTMTSDFLPAASAAAVAALAFNAMLHARKKGRSWLPLAFLFVVLVLKTVFSKGEIVPQWLQIARDMAVAVLVLSAMPQRKPTPRAARQ